VVFDADVQQMAWTTGVIKGADGSCRTREDAMNIWTKSDLDKIARAEELEIATRRRDGTLRDPVTVWIVGVGDDLYVRTVKGRAGAWFRGAVASHQRRFKA
jgi:hypothetical protein